MKNFYYKQPKFYDKFYCIGGDCPYTCCQKWTIVWEKEKVDDIKNNTSHPELAEMAEKYFKPFDEKKYCVDVDTETGRCPFLTETGLCSIQKNLGEEYLSRVCRGYPRLSAHFKNIITRTLDTTCFAVIDLITQSEDSMDLIMKEIKEDKVVSRTLENKEFVNSPSLNYQNEIVDFFYEILNNKERNISASIILGALAAKKITEYCNKEKAHMIPEVLNKLRPQMNDKKQLDSINKMEKNYNFSVGIVNEILKILYRKDVFTVLYTDDKPDVEKSKIGFSKFEEATKDKQYMVKNIILNYFLLSFTYMYDSKLSLYQNYLYFAFVAAAVKLSTAVIGYVSKTNEDIIHDFIDYQPIFARRLYNVKNAKELINHYFESNKINTPAYIALMVK